MLQYGITAALFATLGWAFYNLGTKLSAVRLGKYWSALLFIIGSIVPMIILLCIEGFAWPGLYPMLLSLAAGVLIPIGFILALKSLETEQLTNAIALSEISPALLTIFGLIILHEPVTSTQAVSVVLIFVGAFLVITTEGIQVNKRLIPALLANVIWAIYWILLTISITSSNVFAMQIAFTRFVAIAIALPLFYFISRKNKSAFRQIKIDSRKMLPLLTFALVVGMLDSGSDAIFGFTIHSNLVALGGALSALSPMIVSFLSYFIFKDRLTKLQAVGLIIMIAGALALTLG